MARFQAAHTRTASGICLDAGGPAPGYRPILSSNIHHNPPTGNLRVEGLTFNEGASDRFFPQSIGAQLCFPQLRRPNDVAVGVFGTGQVVEFRNCLTGRFIAVTTDNNRTILVDNCLTGGLAPRTEKPCTVLIRRSVLWEPGLADGLLYLGEPQPALVRAEHSLFVSGGRVIGGDYPATWEGQANVYSVGGPWFWKAAYRTWRRGKKLGSDADARALPPLLLDALQWQLLPGQPKTRTGGFTAPT